jgi:integrase
VNLGTKSELPTKALAKQAGQKYLDAQNHIVQAIRAGQKVDNNGFLKFEVLVEKWKENRLRYSSKGTQTIRLNHVRLWLLPAFKGLPIGDLTPEVLQGAWRRFEKAKLNPATLSLMKQTLSQIFKFAIEFGYLTTNPVSVVKTPKYNPLEKKIFTVEQFKQVLDSMQEERYRDIIYTFGETGVRSGELMGLRIEDLDFEANTISIKRSLDRTRGETTPTKTKSSVRTFHGSPYLMNLLKKYVGDRKEVFVFGWNSHGYVAADTILYQFRKGIKAVGMKPEDFTLHTIRHFNLSLMDSLGISLKLQKQRVGHSTKADITMGTYQHLFRADEALAASKIHEALMVQPEAKTGHLTNGVNPELQAELMALLSKHGVTLQDVVGGSA